MGTWIKMKKKKKEIADCSVQVGKTWFFISLLQPLRWHVGLKERMIVGCVSNC